MIKNIAKYNEPDFDHEHYVKVPIKSGNNKEFKTYRIVKRLEAQIMGMCHRNLAKVAHKEYKKFCPECRKKGKDVKMELILIDPSYLKYKSWEAFCCPECHYEV